MRLDNIMITFIGGKIKQLNELRILVFDKNEENLNKSFNITENNIKINNTEDRFIYQRNALLVIYYNNYIYI